MLCFLACSGAVQIVSRMAVNWNIPHFTYVGMSEVLADKNEFQMLTRLSFTLNLFAKFYIEVFKVSSITTCMFMLVATEFCFTNFGAEIGPIERFLRNWNTISIGFNIHAVFVVF